MILARCFFSIRLIAQRSVKYKDQMEQSSHLLDGKFGESYIPAYSFSNRLSCVEVQ